MKTISLVKQVAANGDDAIDKICDVLGISERQLAIKFQNLADDADNARKSLRLYIQNGIDDSELLSKAEQGMDHWSVIYQLTQKALVYFMFEPIVRDQLNPRTKAGTIRLLDKLAERYEK